MTAEKHFKASLDSFALLPDTTAYLNYIQALYNYLGFLAVNRDENTLGISVLAKAERLGLELLQRSEM